LRLLRPLSNKQGISLESPSGEVDASNAPWLSEGGRVLPDHLFDGVMDFGAESSGMTII
jgi:hypothetical protein